MALECQIISGNTCAISEAGSGHTVPVEVSVSLPDGLTDAAGQPVNGRRLLRDGSGTELFQPGFYVDRRPGTLHFEVARNRSEEHTSELQSLMRISYAAFCLKTKHTY